MAAETIIRADGLWKRYGHPLGAALRRAGAALAGREPPDGPWALRGVSFEVRRGETLGIIGRNGAGKSTLLKLLAGVSPPTRGSIEIRGSVFPMIELNAGMHLELTGRENIRLLGAIMGLPRAAMEAKMEAIADFCELGEWLERPVRTYSSGMMARLGFAVAVNVDAEILLVDEVLATGDVAFQRKCLARVGKLIDGGTTILLVSHNPYLVERICGKSLYLKGGAAVRFGAPAEAMGLYLAEIQNSRLAAAEPAAAPMQEMNARPGSGDVRLESAEFLGADGRPAETARVGEPLRIRLRLKRFRDVARPHFHVALYDEYNTVVAHMQATAEVREKLIFDSDGCVECAIERLPLMPGNYSIGVKIGGGDLLIDSVSAAGRIAVEGSDAVLRATSGLGLMYIPAAWDFIKDGGKS